MTRRCTVTARRACEHAIAEVDTHESVAEADVLSPAQSDRSRWTLELHLATRGVPPVVERRLADHGLATVAVAPRGDRYYVAAVLL